MAGVGNFVTGSKDTVAFAIVYNLPPSLFNLPRFIFINHILQHLDYFFFKYYFIFLKFILLMRSVKDTHFHN